MRYIMTNLNKPNVIKAYDLYLKANDVQIK